MAHIVEFKIDGLAGRKDVYAQKLKQDLNVFFGLNGSGKTSLLRILDSAMSGDARGISMVPFRAAEVTIHSIEYDRDFVRSIERSIKKSTSARRRPKAPSPRMPFAGEEEVSRLELPYVAGEEELQWKTRPLTPDTSNTLWQHMYLPTWRLYVGDEPYLLRRAGLPSMEREYDWDRFFGSRLEELWSRCTNEILSQVRSIQEEGLASLLRGILSTRQVRKTAKQLDPKMVYERVSAFLERQASPGILGSLETFMRKYSTDARLRNAVSDINATEERIEKAMTPRHQLEKLVTSMFSGGKTVVFKDSGIKVETKEGWSIGLASLSSGEKHALWIFIATILAGPSSLLIDELEISMHVDWQRMLISAMRQLNSDAQLIVATHSPEIMGDVADANVFRL